MDTGYEKEWLGDKLINEYHDIKKPYYTLVPIDKKWEDDLYLYKIYDKKTGNVSNHFKYQEFNEVVYCYLEDKLYNVINKKMDKLINMYEEEYIDNDEMKVLKEIVEGIISKETDDDFLKYSNELMELINFAIEKDTILGFLF